MDPETPPTISIERVSRWYGPVIGVNEVTASVFPGLTGLLGPNGSGKSTLMKLITGQMAPSLGTIRVMGRSVARSPGARSQLGFVPEIDRFYEEMRGRDFVYHMARLSGLGGRRSRQRTGEVLEQVGMTSRGDRRLRQCSRGMRQRIKIAQALVHDPPVLILDEPLSGVDPEGRLELIELFQSLARSGKTLLVSSHILEEIEAVTERILLLAGGSLLAAGTLARVRELLTDHPLTLRLAAEPVRSLAALLLREPSVAGVTVEDSRRREGEQELVVRIQHPGDFFPGLPALLEEAGCEFHELEPLDASATAVFEYLLRGDFSTGDSR